MGDSRTGSLPPRRAESRLIKAAADAVKNTCANPDRTDCPDSEAIQAVVHRAAHPNFDDTVDHIAMCAPCLDEYNRRRRDYRFRRRSRWAVGFAALLVLGLFWTYHATRDVRPKPQLVQKNTPPPFVAALLDYSSWTAERSTSPSQSKRQTPTLARARLALTIFLPIGTEDGPYTVRVQSPSGEMVAQANGIATWTGAAEKLSVSLDLTAFSAGAYIIAIQSANASQRTYPVLLE